MSAALTAITFVFIAGDALAQHVPIDGRFMPEWDRRPAAGGFARYYPRVALGDGVPGVVQLCCDPNSARGIHCRVGFEWPENFGFGEAAVSLSRDFRMTEASYAAYQSTPGSWLQVPIIFRVHPQTGNFDIEDVQRRIREGTQGLCRPASSIELDAPAPAG